MSQSKNVKNHHFIQFHVKICIYNITNQILESTNFYVIIESTTASGVIQYLSTTDS